MTDDLLLVEEETMTVTDMLHCYDGTTPVMPDRVSMASLLRYYDELNQAQPIHLGRMNECRLADMEDGDFRQMIERMDCDWLRRVIASLERHRRRLTAYKSMKRRSMSPDFRRQMTLAQKACNLRVHAARYQLLERRIHKLP